MVITRHVDLPHNLFGVSVLASIVGGVATFGGVVTGLFGLYSLVTVKEKISAEIAVQQGTWKNELQKQLNNNLRAFALFNTAKAEENIESANALIEELWKLEQLPVASTMIGDRYYDIVSEWAWSQINTHYSSSKSYEIAKMALKQAISWFQRSLNSSLDVENPDEINFKLAQLFAIDEDLAQSKKHLTHLHGQIPLKVSDRNVAFLLWSTQSLPDAKTIMKYVNTSPIDEFNSKYLRNPPDQSVQQYGMGQRLFLALEKSPNKRPPYCCVLGISNASQQTLFPNPPYFTINEDAKLYELFDLVVKINNEWHTIKEVTPTGE